MKLKAHLAGLRHLHRMAQEPEARDIRTGMDMEGIHGLLCLSVQGRHDSHGLLHGLLRGELGLYGSIYDAGSDLLCEDQDIARLGPVVLLNPLGMDEAGDTEPVERIVILDGMPADQKRARLLYLFRAARHDIPEDFGIKAVREADDIQCDLWDTAHGIDIGESIARSDHAKGIGIIYDRGEKIHSLYHGDFLRHLVDRGIVRGGKPHEKSVILFKFRQLAQNLGKGLRTYLSRSAGLLRHLCELYLFLLLHIFSFCILFPSVFPFPKIAA